MRVVAGSARGLRLVAPPGSDVRPTTSRVREATFNALFSLGLLDDAVIWDLFAGTAAMAIEALSRGAAHAHVVDRSADAIEAIEMNLQTTNFTDRATVHRMDAFSFLKQHCHGHLPSQQGDGTDEAHKVIIVDPPYRFDGWDELLGLLEQAPDATVVVESGDEIETGDRWSIVRTRRYGGSVVTIMELKGAEPTS